MKFYRTIILAAFAMAPLLAFGQNRYDALRFSQQYYQGTARSIAMGNAFTALGGDMGAITINPAASGVYRHSEFALTPSIVNSVSSTDYLNNVSKENRTRFNISNVGYVGNFQTGRKSGILNFSFGIIANQTNNFDSRSSAYGQTASSSWLSAQADYLANSGIAGSSLTMPADNPNYPFYNTNATWKSILAWNTWLIENHDGDEYKYIAATEYIDDAGNYNIEGPLNQRYYQQTTGYTEDVTLNFGGNVSNKFFFGINLTFQSINYQHYESYSETSANQLDFYTLFDTFKYEFNYSTKGLGFNMKAGIIYLPVAGLRLGASVSTPTWMTLTDVSYEDITSTVYGENYSASTPYNNYQYKVNAPFRWSAGAAYTFGKIALVSVDYEGASYSQTKFVTNSSMSTSDIAYFNEENYQMRNNFRTVSNIRAGVEVKVIPSLAIRAGYSFYDSAEKGYHGQIQYASAGLGYSDKSGFFADVAYQQQCNKLTDSYSFYSYNLYDSSIPVATENYLNWKVLLSIGFRF